MPPSIPGSTPDKKPATRLPMFIRLSSVPVTP